MAIYFFQKDFTRIKPSQQLNLKTVASCDAWVDKAMKCGPQISTAPCENNSRKLGGEGLDYNWHNRDGCSKMEGQFCTQKYSRRPGFMHWLHPIPSGCTCNIFLKAIEYNLVHDVFVFTSSSRFQKYSFCLGIHIQNIQNLFDIVLSMVRRQIRNTNKNITEMVSKPNDFVFSSMLIIIQIFIYEQ